ncbi:hypothetical protein FACS189426_09180 [Bacteroidia bacterium]|nr:hypothetical protein FACS189426_09180 [Bacteroidia bacterium]
MAGLGILNYGYDYSVDLGEYGSYGSNGSTSDIAFNLGGGVDYKLTVHSGLLKANSPSHRSGFIPVAKKKKRGLCSAKFFHS